jgi:hypothetical protein
MGDYVVAAGYVTATAVVLRGLDVLSKWRSNQRTGNVADLELARKYQDDALRTLRQQLEDERRENVVLATRLDISEKKVLEQAAALAISDSALKDAEAELRLIRKDAAAANERRDIEDDRHSAVEHGERARRPRSRLKP